MYKYIYQNQLTPAVMQSFLCRGTHNEDLRYSEYKREIRHHNQKPYYLINTDSVISYPINAPCKYDGKSIAKIHFYSIVHSRL